MKKNKSDSTEILELLKKNMHMQIESCEDDLKVGRHEPEFIQDLLKLFKECQEGFNKMKSDRDLIFHIQVSPWEASDMNFKTIKISSGRNSFLACCDIKEGLSRAVKYYKWVNNLSGHMTVFIVVSWDIPGAEDKFNSWSIQHIIPDNYYRHLAEKVFKGRDITYFSPVIIKSILNG